MRAQILKLRDEGKTCYQIAKELGMSASTVRYHASESEKARIKEKDNTPLASRIRRFKQRKDKNGKRAARTDSFTWKDVVAKFGWEPKCYLTGRQLSLMQPETFHFDHIMPTARGGDNSFSNLGIASKEANLGKNGQTVDEYVETSIAVTEYAGHFVVRRPTLMDLVNKVCGTRTATQ